MRGRWNSDPKIGGGGVLIDNGTHSVDIVRYLLGPIKRIHASAGKNIQGLPVEETAGISLVTESGVMGTVYLSWSIKIEEAGYINIFGSDGALTLGWKGSKFQHNGHSEWVSFGSGYDKIGAFKNQVSNFAGTIRGGDNPIITADDGLASVKAVEAAYRSMSEGNWVELEETSSHRNPSTNS